MIAPRMLLIALACVIAPGAGAAELGRLFFDPAQRAEIEKRRHVSTKVQPPPATPPSERIEVKPPAPEPDPLGTATINGRVVRSSGRSTTWVNGEPQHDARLGNERARAQVPGPAKAGPSTVKIGQTLDRDTGAVSDGLKGGRVEVDRR